MFKQTLDLRVTPYVFVYGTLKRNRGNDRLLFTSEFIEEGTVQEGGALKGYGIPFFIPDFQLPEEKIGNIHGEVWKVDDPVVLARLDRLESHPNAYYRSVVEVAIPREQDILFENCWTYYFSREGLWNDEIGDNLRQADGSYRF